MLFRTLLSTDRGTKGQGQAGWPHNVTKKTALFSCTFIHYESFFLKNENYTCVFDSIRSFSSTVYKGAFGEAGLRHRRGILELAGAVRCSTGRSPFAYLRYGCYCGLGGKGWPKDRVDWCCFQHDCCYGRAERAGCQPKTEVYQWECEDNAVVCESLEDKCQKMACECDREAAKCFSKAPYHTKFLLWPDFLCSEVQPLCRY
nr:group 10 secretory phospholipase A2 [Columba livia]